MGGFGSGRPGWHNKAEHYRSIDVNWLHRNGCLRPGWRGNLQWARDGERIASINLRAEENRLQLHFNYRFRGLRGKTKPCHQNEDGPVFKMVTFRRTLSPK